MAAYPAYYTGRHKDDIKEGCQQQPRNTCSGVYPKSCSETFHAVEKDMKKQSRNQDNDRKARCNPTQDNLVDNEKQHESDNESEQRLDERPLWPVPSLGNGIGCAPSPDRP